MFLRDAPESPGVVRNHWDATRAVGLQGLRSASRFFARFGLDLGEQAFGSLSGLTFPTLGQRAHPEGSRRAHGQSEEPPRETHGVLS